MQRTAAKIHDHLKNRAKHVLLVSHPRPDGDTLSSACSFMQYLDELDITHTAYCTTEVPSQLKFLPNSHKVDEDGSIFEKQEFDTICVFDSGDLKYAGIEQRITDLPYAPTIINFDHHYTNTDFGHHNFVMRDAASTTEVLYHYFNHVNAPIDHLSATCLLTGLITDTGNFSNQGTTNRSLHVASELINFGARYDHILDKTMRNKTIRTLQLWGLMLSRLALDEQSQVSYTYITRFDIEELGATEEQVDGLANFLNSLGEGKAILVMRETADGGVKGSMRTVHDDIDVSAWAIALGGGGHTKAAGFFIPNASIANEQDAWALFSPALAQTNN